MTNQTQNNNLNNLTDSTFAKANRMFVFHLKMKTIEHLFESIMYQISILKTLMYKSMEKVSLTCQ